MTYTKGHDVMTTGDLAKAVKDAQVAALQPKKKKKKAKKVEVTEE